MIFIVYINIILYNMNGYERVKAALQHQEADQVPLDLGSRSSAIEIEAYQDLLTYLGIDESPVCFIRAHASMSEEVCRILGVDTRWVRVVPQGAWSKNEEGPVYTDAWGVPWVKKEGTHYYELGGPPLSSKALEELTAADFPPLIENGMLHGMAEETRRRKKEGFYVGNDTIGAGVFERSWYLRGFAQVLMETAMNEGPFRDYLESIADHQIAYYTRLVTAAPGACDAVWITDDVAGQDGMIISPEFYRRTVKPVQARLIKALKELGVDVVFHSCGAITEVLNDFIEIGATVLHPIQLNAKGIDRRILKRDFGASIVFWGGGIDVELMRSGTKEEISNAVKKALDILAPGGGFVFTPTHCIQPGTPPENIMCMVETLQEYGRY